MIINDEYRGITPLKLAVTPDTNQRLQVYKAGYLLSGTSESVAPEQELVQEIALKADIIPVKVSVSPSDAVVYVDGQRRGPGSQTLSLTSLPHSISCLLYTSPSPRD